MTKSLNRALLKQVQSELKKYNEKTEKPVCNVAQKRITITSIKPVNSRRLETNKKLNNRLDFIAQMIK